MNKKIVILSIIVSLLVVGAITVSSYAYFTIANGTGTESVITSGNMALTLTDGAKITTGNMIPGDYIEKEFSIENTGNVATSYDVYLSEVINTFVDKTDFVYEITSLDGGYNTTNQVQLPSVSSKIVNNQTIGVGVTHHYKLKITFLAKNENQDDNQGRVFSGTIQVNEYKDVEATINYYYKNVLVNEMPTTNAEFINGTCDKNASILFDTTNFTYEVTNLTDKNTTCNLYFADPTSKTLALLQSKNSDITVQETTPTFTNVDTSTNSYLYKSTDDYGDTYYFRGATSTNYLSFAGYCWRIIRINGDGSLRLLYDGTTCHSNGSTATDNVIATNQYFSLNGVNNNPKYLGYMVGDYNSTTGLYGNDSNSNIKNVVDSWYNNTLVPAIGIDNVDQYLADMYFCNDRKIYSGNGVNGDNTFYPYIRIRNNWSPSFICPQSNDLFTNTTSSVGNKMLGSVKAGLFTADEANFAGTMISAVNKKYYMYNGLDVWTGSPWSFNGSYAVGDLFFLRNTDGGQLHYRQSQERASVRPVINVKSSNISSGTGVIDNPFTIVIE